ncbi:hypothetical protein T02_16542 [Trichinella nativa]|uniref:Uncharacterized protein n=1 Tax=Trichinella nativa TaxID=6335 RepID=A0A0V1KQD4_9BILA|nr:hypothetical protein T02_16542 [Trichinella nativa]
MIAVKRQPGSCIKWKRKNNRNRTTITYNQLTVQNQLASMLAIMCVGVPSAAAPWRSLSARAAAALRSADRRRPITVAFNDEQVEIIDCSGRHRLLSCVIEKTAVDTCVRRRACTQRLKTATSWPEARKEFDTFSANQPTGRHRQQHNSTYISQATRRSKQH